jgi:hypothetical protein
MRMRGRPIGIPGRTLKRGGMSWRGCLLEGSQCCHHAYRGVLVLTSTSISELSSLNTRCVTTASELSVKFQDGTLHFELAGRVS